MPKAKSTDDLGARIVKLKDDDGKTWKEISDAVGKPQGKCMFLYFATTVTSKNKIAGKTEDDLRKAIAKARQDGISWGIISARSGKSEGYCKKAFEDLTGQAARGDRIGKGGRYPGDATPAKPAGVKPPKAKGAVKKATKAAPVKKAAKKVAAKKIPAKKIAGKKIAAKKAAAAAA